MLRAKQELVTTETQLSEFNATEYFVPDRRFNLGAVTYYEGPDVWALEIAPYDTASAEMIEALYRASQAGVPIKLIVRGVCCLRPGVPGLSDNITVRSVVGRFLEHSRVYWFGNEGKPEIFCSSADWMERNLLRRVETCFPILDPALAERVFNEELANYLADNQQAWQLHADGRYSRALPAPDAMPYSAQGALLAKICHR